MQWDIHGLILPSLQFISTGQNSVAFRVVKEIKCGDELTAYYGNHYYGENNYDCRCATCERWVVVPWLPTGFLLWGDKWQMTGDTTAGITLTHVLSLTPIGKAKVISLLTTRPPIMYQWAKKRMAKWKLVGSGNPLFTKKVNINAKKEVYFSHAEITFNAVPFRLSCGCLALWSGTAWTCY